jgi:hypothetical protein
MNKLWRGFLAAITSPEAIRQEKSLAVLIATRLLIAAGAGASVVGLVAKLAG